MPTVIIIGEAFARAVNTDKDGPVYERGWRVWKQDTNTGRAITSTIPEIEQELIDTATIGLDDAYSSDKPGLKCFSLEVRSDDAVMFDVSAKFKAPDIAQHPDDFNDFMNQSNGEGADNPENPFGPKFSGNGQTVEEYRWKDLDGNAILNSAGQPLQNVPAFPVPIQVKRVTVSERTPADTSRQGLCDGKRLLANISYQSAEHVNRKTGVRTRYYENTYEVWVHPETEWSHVTLLNMGFLAIFDFKIDGVNVTKLAHIRVDEIDEKTEKATGTKVRVTEAQPLDAGGRWIENTGLGAASRPSEKKFRARREGALNVPYGL